MQVVCILEECQYNELEYCNCDELEIIKHEGNAICTNYSPKEIGTTETIPSDKVDDVSDEELESFRKMLPPISEELMDRLKVAREEKINKMKSTNKL